MRRTLLLLFTTVASLSVACGGDTPSSPSSITALTVSGTAPGIGAFAQFTATAAQRDGSSRPVTAEAAWTSSNPAVATVDKGIVRGVAPGETDIIAAYESTIGKLRITVDAVTCSFSVSPSTVSIPAGGGTGRVSVFTSPREANCRWTAASNASFVTITSPTSNNGDGATTISVLPNSGPARTGLLTIAGRQVTVSQGAGDCVTSVSPSAVDFSAELKRGTVTVTAAAGCQWTATSSSPFIGLSSFGVSGTGNGSFTYRVFGNLTGAARVGAIQVLPQAVTVTQRAALGGNFLSFVSDTGDYIGQGWTLLHEAPTSTFTSTPDTSRNRVSMRIVGSDGLGTLNWNLELAAPQGQQLAPGTYVSATRYPFQAPTVPGLSFSGDGRGCNQLSGQFTISELVYASDGSVQRLRATFEQHCEGGGPALRGTMSYTR